MKVIITGGGGFIGYRLAQALLKRGTLADADGKEFIKERVALAKSKGKFWQDYKFTDPVTKKVLRKSAYCEKAGDNIVCAGVYKR